LLSALKWLLAYISTLFLFPKIKPFVKNVIDNEHILNIGLSVTIFILAIFVILTINKGISKTISHLGLGNFDKIFGFFFGFIRGYIICVCLFTAVNILYNYSKWPLNLHESLTFSYVKKGSNYLIKEFPDEENYKNTKKQIEEL
jgi:membrane protein required for colicin V production